MDNMWKFQPCCYRSLSYNREGGGLAVFGLVLEIGKTAALFSLYFFSQLFKKQTFVKFVGERAGKVVCAS